MYIIECCYLACHSYINLSTVKAENIYVERKHVEVIKQIKKLKTVPPWKHSTDIGLNILKKNNPAHSS